MSDETGLAPALAALLGKTLKGQYKVELLLGQGGMGAVFQGRHTKLGKVVAIKVLHIQTANLVAPSEFEARFRREAQLASQLAHANVAQVFDFDLEDGMPYMVMEFVAGVDLSEVIRKEAPIPPTRALQILRELALALQEAASQHVVHRDIKPGNIRLQNYQPGGPLLLKVLDFGLAKRVSAEEEKNQLTAPGSVMGTVAYMAPEQIAPDFVHKRFGQATAPPASPAPPRATFVADERIDLYAAGVILYYSLTGNLPFSGNQQEMMAGHLFQDVPPLPVELPEGVRSLCMQLLAKNPAERIQSATTLIAAIEELLAGRGDKTPVIPTTTPPMPVTPPWRRYPLVFTVVFSTVLLLGWALWLKVCTTEPQPRDFSVAEKLVEPVPSKITDDLATPADLSTVKTADPATPSPPQKTHTEKKTVRLSSGSNVSNSGSSEPKTDLNSKSEPAKSEHPESRVGDHKHHVQ